MDSFRSGCTIGSGNSQYWTAPTQEGGRPHLCLQPSPCWTLPEQVQRGPSPRRQSAPTRKETTLLKASLTHAQRGPTVPLMVGDSEADVNSGALAGPTEGCLLPFGASHHIVLETRALGR